MAALFACTKCNSRHPFEELSPGQQLCKDCRCMHPLSKCTYCRSEFQESSKGGGSVCKKCEVNVKLYGKPSACEYCSIPAAFIGAKCKRCANSEKRFGPPQTCEQCKQRCAFDRKDDCRKKFDGKLLCWLCTQSNKRVLAKTKQNIRLGPSSSLTKSSGHRLASSSSSSSQNHKRPSKKHTPTKEHSPSKKTRTEISKPSNGALPASESALLDSGNSDHVVAIHQMSDQIASLKKQLTIKDQQMLAKEKQYAEDKAQMGLIERELRLKIHSMQKTHTDLVENLQSKIRFMQKQMITTNKANKKGKDTDKQEVL